MTRTKSDPKHHDSRWDSDVKPAPGELRLIQAFVSSKDFANPRALADWLALWGLVTPGTKLTEDELRRALEVRDGLRELVRANQGRAVNDAALARLDQAAETAILRVRFASGGRTRYEPVSAGLDGALARMCSIVATAQSEGLWPRLKICAGESCGSAFYDFSKNRSAKWCLPKCGNRVSASVYRQRNLRTVREKDRVKAWARRLSW